MKSTSPFAHCSEQTCGTRKSYIYSNIIPVFILLFFFSDAASQEKQLSKAKVSAVNYAEKLNSYKGFIRNFGQIGSLEENKSNNVLYKVCSAGDADVYITTSGISYVYKKLLSKKAKLTKDINSHKQPNDTNYIFKFEVERIDAVLKNAHIDTADVEEEYSGSRYAMNYYNGGLALTGKKMIRKIRFKNIYKNIDWILYLDENNHNSKLKYDFIVHEGANTNDIKIQYSSNADLSETGSAGIKAKGRLGFIEEGRPYLKASDGRLLTNKISYSLSKNSISYNFDNTALSYPLIIDPDLTWGTFLSSATVFDGIHWSIVKASDIETDKWNNVFVALGCKGTIKFPTLNPGGGAYYNSVYDSTNGSSAYMKFDENGVLLWSTFFESGGVSEVITVDNDGTLIVASHFSKPLPYKNNGGYFDTTSFSQTFLAKFDKNGILAWCTRWANGSLFFSDITVDVDDNFYFTGHTSPMDLPVKNPGNGAYFNTKSFGTENFFVTSFDKNCNLKWSTTIEGGGIDNSISRICVDKNRNVYMLAELVRSEDYLVKDAGGYFSPAGHSFLTKFDSAYKVLWSSAISASYDIDVDTSGNVYAVGSTYSAASFPYTDPGNGAYMDTNYSTSDIAGSILKFDNTTNLIWATTYYGVKNFRFLYINYEKYRDLIHIYGIMNDIVKGFPTQNDICDGDYYYSSDEPNTATDPVMLTFTAGGKRVYASLNGFPYAYYQIAETTVDPKGNAYYIFGQIQESGPLIDFPSLKDPGGNSFYEEGKNNYLSYASFLMRLSPSDNLGVLADSVLPKTCNCDGYISVTPACGSGKYKYKWSRGDTTASIYNVCPGTYLVEITDLNTNNFIVRQFTMPNPDGNIKNAQVNKEDAHCEHPDGKLVVLNINGGPGPYQYSLNNDPFQKDSVFKGLTAGTYAISVKDADGCMFTDSVSLINLPGPEQLFTTITATGCIDSTGSIIVDSVYGGIAPFIYSLNEGEFSSSNIFTGLKQGQYIVIVQDSSGCKLKDSVKIKTLNGPQSFAAAVADTHCNQPDGKILISNINGGKSPYLFSLNDIDYNPDSLFTGLPEGNYSVYITDAAGCKTDSAITINNLSGPDSIYYTKTDALCGAAFGSVIIDSVRNGVGPYVFSYNSGVYSSVNTNATLNPGKNFLSVKDSAGCIFDDSLDISASGPLDVKIKPGDTTLCTGYKFTFLAEEISVNPPVSYFWNNSAFPSLSYSNNFYTDADVLLYAKDGNGCISYDTSHIKIKYCDSLLEKCIQFPSAFTPNNDGLNDKFGPVYQNCDIMHYHLQIYNRFGQIVFQANNLTSKWDGNVAGILQQQGSFVYYCDWTDALNTKRTQKGIVTLIR